jgi:hypothetical protein
MAKLQLDPKKMAVVKKTVTTAGPVAKSKNGVPKSAKEAIKYLDSELERHDLIMKDLSNREKSLKGKKGSELELLDVQNKLRKNWNNYLFLQSQKGENQSRLFKAQENAEKRAAAAKEAAKTPLQKFGDKAGEIVRKLGSSGNPVF